MSGFFAARRSMRAKVCLTESSLVLATIESIVSAPTQTSRRFAVSDAGAADCAMSAAALPAKPRRDIFGFISASLLLGCDGLHLHSFAHHVARVQNDDLAFGEAAGDFQAVAVVAAHLHLLQMNGAAALQHSDQSAIAADNQSIARNPQRFPCAARS